MLRMRHGVEEIGITARSWSGRLYADWRVRWRSVKMADVVDELLRYGLFFGAIFQLICIAAVVFIPPKEDGRDGGDSSDDDTSTEGQTHQPSHRHHTHHPSRRSRQEKKKRR
ncbi:protein MANBAL-like [Centruroides sculpturatus]|uniref:protein MANBAL-like n=1 Tax=Centruroides sculpturatus TaxID=218467 RepID=UPI000C6E8E77|nr:protein MANBAL-like [Centruroides sculpturatus]